MSKDNESKFKPGWLAEDVAKATARAAEWTATAPAPMTTDNLIEELERLIDAATPGDLSTAEGGSRDQEGVECPACGGEGVVSATDYLNFDGAATGVQFFGIGPEHGAHERLWCFFMENRKSILSALKENQRLREALTFVLPLAKGYAHEHPVGANQRHVDDAIAVLAALQPQKVK